MDKLFLQDVLDKVSVLLEQGRAAQVDVEQVKALAKKRKLCRNPLKDFTSKEYKKAEELRLQALDKKRQAKNARLTVEREKLDRELLLEPNDPSRGSLDGDDGSFSISRKRDDGDDGSFTISRKRDEVDDGSFTISRKRLRTSPRQLPSQPSAGGL